MQDWERSGGRPKSLSFLGILLRYLIISPIRDPTYPDYHAASVFKTTVSRVYKFLLFVVMLGVQVFSLSAQGNIKSSEPSVARQNTPKSAITNVVDRAHTLIGTPYRWGGSTLTEGFDCSGLLVYLFLNEARIKLPRTTTAMQRSKVSSKTRKE